MASKLLLSLLHLSFQQSHCCTLITSPDPSWSSVFKVVKLDATSRWHEAEAQINKTLDRNTKKIHQSLFSFRKQLRTFPWTWISLSASVKQVELDVSHFPTMVKQRHLETLSPQTIQFKLLIDWVTETRLPWWIRQWKHCSSKVYLFASPSLWSVSVIWSF